MATGHHRTQLRHPVGELDAGLHPVLVVDAQEEACLVELGLEGGHEVHLDGTRGGHRRQQRVLVGVHEAVGGQTPRVGALDGLHVQAVGRLLHPHRLVRPLALGPVDHRHLHSHHASQVGDHSPTPMRPRADDAGAPHS
ncbi:hypothetical protein GCM10027030_10890 [Luteococcus sediminum]